MFAACSNSIQITEVLVPNEYYIRYVPDCVSLGVLLSGHKTPDMWGSLFYKRKQNICAHVCVGKCAIQWQIKKWLSEGTMVACFQASRWNHWVFCIKMQQMNLINRWMVQKWISGFLRWAAWSGNSNQQKEEGSVTDTSASLKVKAVSRHFSRRNGNLV